MTGAPLETRELATLLVRLEQAVRETSGRFRMQMAFVSGLFVVMALAMGFRGSWAIAAFVFAFAIGIALLGRVASRRTAPERMQPVVDAVRDAPDTIVSVRHTRTSDTAQLFVTHWIEIKTAEHRLLVKAPDWVELCGYLERRCPNATLN